MSEWALEMSNITKEFSGIKALDNVTFQVKKGEIHALCGENGAGKSTLMKILSGVYEHGTYTGEISIQGETVTLQNVSDSEKMGIGIIYQELALVPEFTISENIFLGKEPLQYGLIDNRSLHQEAAKWISQVGLEKPPTTRVKQLGIGEQQLVEIAKALKNQAQILILDEPTAALTDKEVQILLEILRDLRRNGVTCIYISHKLEEVLEIADMVTVLRDGKTISTKSASELCEQDIIALMVGRDLTELFPKVITPPGDVMLEVKNWSVVHPDTNRKIVSDVSFSVRKGEIVGIAGLIGSGRTELVTSIFGSYLGASEGELQIEGKRVFLTDPKDAIAHGIALVSEDRKRFGLVLGMDVMKNTTLASLSSLSGKFAIDSMEEYLLASKMVDHLRIKIPSLVSLVGKLSGGNQQKVVIAKWLLTNPKILILDEPTRGIDVGAKYEIYQLLNELTQSGLAVLIISSELPEVIGMSDRILVMGHGRLQGELSRGVATQEEIMRLATRGQS